MGLKAEISQLPHKRKSDLEHLPSLQFSLHFTLFLSLPAPTASRLPFKSNSDFHFPMPLVTNHGLGLGFQDSTRLHFSKSKLDFPYPSLLGSDSKPSSLSYKLVFSECSSFSLLSSLSSDFKISPFYFEINTPLHQNLSSFFTPLGCCCRRLTTHLTPSSSLHGSS